MNLANVVNLFVMETANATAANISADIYLDNIRLAIACPGNIGCVPRHRVNAVEGELLVFDDNLDPAWGTLSAFDEAIGYGSCVNDNGAGCPSISWAVVSAADTARGQIIDVSYPQTAKFAGLVVGGALSAADDRDLSAYASGEIRFDVLMTANPNGRPLRAKVDCRNSADENACPSDMGQREVDLGVLPLNVWTEATVDIASMGTTLNLGKVTTGLVIFPPFGQTSGVSFQLDNVRWSAEVSIPMASGAVYDNAVDSQWGTNKLAAFDQAIGFNSCTDDGGAGCPSIAWSEVDAAGRGKVIQVTYSGTQFAGLIVGQDTGGLDFRYFRGGTVKFDLMVTANPSNVNFRMKVDCTGCPVDSGQREQDLGKPPLNTWMSYSVNVDDIVDANNGPGMGGLVLQSVTTGLVIFPPFGMTEGVSYQLDNVRWEAAASAP